MPDILMFSYKKKATKTTINEFDIVDGAQSNIKVYSITTKPTSHIKKYYPKHKFFHIKTQEKTVFVCFAEPEKHNAARDFLVKIK